MRGIVVPLALAAATLAGRGREAAARDVERPAGGAPASNSSYVPEDVEEVVRAFSAAEAAAKAKDWTTTVRALQRAAEGPARAVAPVSEVGVFEGARVVAHHAVVRHGPDALAAYQREFGGLAETMLATAVERFDLGALAGAADRYLPSAEGRAALLALVDLLVESGDPDAALGWLERLEDLGDACGPGLEAERERWARARAPREEVALGLTTATRTSATRAGDSPDWPTTGGAPSRARTTASLPPSLSLAWCVPIRTRDPADEEYRLPPPPGAAPSPWIPPRVVVSGTRAYVSDGRALQAFDLETGRRTGRAPLHAARPGRLGVETPPGGGEEGEEARERWQWIEGHALTVEGDAAWCAVARGTGRDGHVVAFRLEAERPRRAWDAGGSPAPPDVPGEVALHGAPCLYRGTLYVAGTRKRSEDRFETVLVALDPGTGERRFETSLGVGGPIRRRRDDEVVPASVAAARGRVVVSTSIGVAAAVDAQTGRTLWSYRYDRGSPDGDTQSARLAGDVREPPRRSSFANEPPLLAGGRCFLAPTDSREIVCTFDRPRGARRLLTAWKRGRTEGVLNLAVEHLAGATDGREGAPPTLLAVGQGHLDPSEVHACVVALDPETGAVRWGRALPDGGPPEPYGRAAVTATQAYVPTRTGIASFRLADGALVEFVGPEETAQSETEIRPTGNLVVAPGRGVLAVNGDFLTFWRAR